MTNLDQLAQHLAETEIFKALQPQFHEAIAGKCEVRTYKKDQKIVSQGDRGDEFFLILSGTVAILLEDFALWSEQRILELHEGQSFGESALLNDNRRTATVKTLDETTCAVLNRSSFEKLMGRVPEVGVAISKYLAQRLAVQCQLTGYRFVSGDELVFNPKIDSYAEQIAPARSFNTFENIDMAQKAGKVGGGYLNSHIIMYDGKVINTELRYPDEFVRHKILDLIGDLYLVGFPIEGRFTANMTSHGYNQALVKQMHTALMAN